MVVREKFEGELQELKVNVVRMGDMAVTALDKAYKALLDKAKKKSKNQQS